MLTGTRVTALTSLRLSHVDMVGGYVDQDARTVQTKFAKTFRTYFMPVSERALGVVADWHAELSADVRRGPDNALFPATMIALDEGGGFAAAGLHRQGWSTSEPVRAIFRRAFALACLPYFNPHSFRDMLVRHAMTLHLSAEAMKAWSQNLGHADVLTTFTSYGSVPTHRQGELIRTAGSKDAAVLLDDPDIRALVAKIRGQTAQRPLVPRWPALLASDMFEQARRRERLQPHDRNRRARGLGEYVVVGESELDTDKLPELLQLKYGSPADGIAALGNLAEIRSTFQGFQRGLYDRLTPRSEEEKEG
jgi:hypothetical protein